MHHRCGFPKAVSTSAPVSSRIALPRQYFTCFSVPQQKRRGRVTESDWAWDGGGVRSTEINRKIKLCGCTETTGPPAAAVNPDAWWSDQFTYASVESQWCGVYNRIIRAFLKPPEQSNLWRCDWITKWSVLPQPPVIKYIYCGNCYPLCVRSSLKEDYFCNFILFYAFLAWYFEVACVQYHIRLAGCLRIISEWRRLLWNVLLW